jgi:hypothetical protein
MKLSDLTSKRARQRARQAGPGLKALAKRNGRAGWKIRIVHGKQEQENFEDQGYEEVDLKH